MKGKIYLYYLFLILFGCGEAESNTALELFVYNRNSEPEDSAKVSIYRDSLDWVLEKNAVRSSQLTNSDGRVRFFGLENGLYYIDVVKNNLSNWEGRVHLPLYAESDFSLNTELIIVNRNRSGIISKASGAKWYLSKAELNGSESSNSLNSCTLDDTLVFYKGRGKGEFVLKEGKKICAGQNDSRKGIWELNEAGSELIITDIQPESWKIVSAEPETLIVSRSLGGFLFRMTYRRAP